MRDSNAHRGVVGATSGERVPQLFFHLFLLRGPREDDVEKGEGGSQDAGTAPGRKHLVDEEKNSGNERGKSIRWREREREKRNRPLRYPEWHRFRSLAEGAKKTDFQEGSKKT